MDKRVREMFDGQLRAAGFDPDLSAGDLSVRNSVRKPQQKESEGAASYASVAMAGGTSVTQEVVRNHDHSSSDNRREEKFWPARRSLRLWPLGKGEMKDLDDYLLNKLRLDRAFVEDEVGQVIITRTREPRNKNKEEFVVMFESGTQSRPRLPTWPTIGRRPA